MSRALEPVAASRVGTPDSHYSWTDGRYSYSIARAGKEVVYEVSDGRETLKAPLSYAFGQGKAGQTYVFTLDGRFYESRVSYYDKLKGLDLTVGAMNTKPATILEAAGRVMDSRDARNCFGCHTTGARVGNTLQLDHFEAGVQCESCHGPGGAHVDSIKDGKPAPKSIRSLRGMDALEANEMCGVCHRTWDAIMTMGLKGPNNARFPPYRLTNSKCFSPDDARIACTACHNPHQALVKDAAFYDSKCLACHKKQTCPVAQTRCTSCHMPRIDAPEAHHAFPDHWIRVAKGGYPD